MHHLKDESPVMGFLDALGMPRAEVRASAATALREKLLSAVPTLPPDRLRALLVESFPRMREPELAPVVAKLLEHAPELPADAIATLTDREVLAPLPLRVKHRVWSVNPMAPDSLFSQEVMRPLIRFCDDAGERQNSLGGSYSRTPQELFMEEAADSVDAGPTPKQRREKSAALKTVSELVGTAQLYAAALATCREVYTYTSDRSIAELRVALLMAIHDKDDAARPVRNWDAEFKFVWMLDACVRDGRIAPRLMRDLIHHAAPLGLADPLNPDDAPPPVGAAEAAERAARLADLALALCGVRSQQLLAREALLLCHKAVDDEALPRDDATARGVCRLIALSAQANSRLKFIAAAAAEAEVLRKSASDKATAESAGALLQRFLPIVAGMIADDRLRDRAKSAVARKAEPPPPDKYLIRMAAGGAPHGIHAPARPQHAALRIVLLYALQRLRAADDARLAQLLLPLAEAETRSKDHGDARLPIFLGGKDGLFAKDHPDAIAAFAELVIKNAQAQPKSTLTAAVASVVLVGFLNPLRASGVAEAGAAIDRVLKDGACSAQLAQLYVPGTNHTIAAALAQR